MPRQEPANDVRHGQATSIDRAFSADYVPYSMALLDQQGRIVAVNAAWRKFGRENAADQATFSGVGLSYLDICRSSEDPAALAVHDGLRNLLDRRCREVDIVYPCHSPTQVRWCRLLAQRPDGDGGEGAVIITHLDATDAWVTQAYQRVQASLARALTSHTPMLQACRELALAVCKELEWDYAGVWTIDLSSWTLRCRDTWSRPSLCLSSLEKAIQEASLDPGVGLPGRAWMTAKVQWATDLDLDLNTRTPPDELGHIMPPSALAAGFRTALSFPLKCGDDVLAVVDLFSRTRRPPDRSLMDLLESAGDQLALWELRERAEECARAAQSQADDARAQLESVLDCAPAFISVIDGDRNIQFVNRTLSHQTKDELIGQPWQTCILPEHHVLAEAALSNVFQTGVAQSYESAGRDHQGQARWFLTHIGPIRNGATITGAVVIAQDVTATKLAQSELADAQRLATVGTLAAGVAHEINTPIQFVNDSIHFLREAATDLFTLLNHFGNLKHAVESGAAPERLNQALEATSEAEDQADLPYLLENVPKAFERSVEGLERVTTIVRSMKEFAHPTQKEMAPADLNRAIMSTLTVARNEYKFVADLETELGQIPPVLCHLGDINQVVLNIVVNAAHAIEEVVRGSDRRGVITVKTHQDGGDVLISISDTGGGIPEAVRSRIFDPFFTTKEVGRGTGQGLAIAKAAVREKHGGELSFETKLGHGTTFLIRLPIQTTRPSRVTP